MNKKTTTVLSIIGVIVAMAIVARIFIPFFNEMYKQVKYKPVESALGFNISTPYVDGREVIQFSVIPDGVAETSGLENEDILNRSRIGKFLEGIYEAQGQPYSFNVLRDSETITIDIDEVPTIDLK